jgi:radical SAM superfamily enzyme YgiQ (UPF0313 family)
MSSTKKKAILVGIAGSHNAFSLSLYNLKAYAFADAATRAAWSISVIQHPLITATYEETKIPPLVERIVAARPDLVGFSTYMWNVQVFKTLAVEVREHLPNTAIAWGGPEIASEYLLEGKFEDFEVDFCIAGEGELTFRELLGHLSTGSPPVESIHGLAWRRERGAPLTVNAKRHPFDSLLRIPSPFLSGVVDDEVLTRPKVEANIETQRGCNLKCSYCIYHKDMSRISYSSADRTLDETRYVVNKGVKRIRFVDANFTSDLDHAKAIMRGYIKERFETRLMFELIPGFIDEELAALLGEYSALYPWNEITCGVGVQTINLKILKRLRRKIKKEEFERTFNLLQKYGIFTKIDLIIGLPGEDLESIETTLEYMLEQLRGGQRHLLCCHTMRGLPGTELMEMAKEFGMVFSSAREPHELIESPALPREHMLRCLRRTAVVFRLTNHEGWADREFISERQRSITTIRDEFFRTRDALGISNVALVDHLIEGLMPALRERDSWFAQPDFPYAETWWWNYSALEIKNETILDVLSALSEPLAASGLQSRCSGSPSLARHMPRGCGSTGRGCRSLPRSWGGTCASPTG